MPRDGDPEALIDQASALMSQVLGALGGAELSGAGDL
jgi:hypothetical protein